jgi:hypothetical protein
MLASHASTAGSTSELVHIKSLSPRCLPRSTPLCLLHHAQYTHMILFPSHHHLPLLIDLVVEVPLQDALEVLDSFPLEPRKL